MADSQFAQQLPERVAPADGAAGSRTLKWRVLLRFIVETVTALGWTIIILFGICFFAVVFGGWQEAFFIMLACATVLIIALPFLLGGRDYTPELFFGRSRTVAGSNLSGNLRLLNSAKRAQPATELELTAGSAILKYTAPALASSAAALLPLELRSLPRGVLNVGPLKIMRSDPLGLFKRETVWHIGQTIFVHPETVPLNLASVGFVPNLEGVNGSKLTDSDFAFHAIRDYQPGDQQRHLDWRSTARTGKLKVKQFTQTQSAKTLFVLDITAGSYTDADDFELALSAIASIAVASAKEMRGAVFAVVGGAARGGYRILQYDTGETLLDELCGLYPSAQPANLRLVAQNMAQALNKDFTTTVYVTGTAGMGNAVLLRELAPLAVNSENMSVVRAAAQEETAAQRLRGRAVITIGELTDMLTYFGGPA
ncbi:DUF58 domain-containing protein [Canibacter sp. lx-72]|uniref:DUF58 domain-containing protein n=1 Tax=Canibacter zhuwentaonis TaxID=2837491 RepID=UPI001BDD6CC6|nr:DUF58 domain-containing protein [Canibacter zhuwentaonis]MBT1018647.1 DUF58 domain-containing protein [Canibacter zhuwentaonis]